MGFFPGEKTQGLQGAKGNSLQSCRQSLASFCVFLLGKTYEHVFKARWKSAGIQNAYRCLKLGEKTKIVLKSCSLFADSLIFNVYGYSIRENPGENPRGEPFLVSSVFRNFRENGLRRGRGNKYWNF